MHLSRGSETKRSSLEIFILALISEGLSTTYALQREAGLSLGATVPALKRLQSAGLVTKKIIGRRHEFNLLRAGKVALSDWQVGSAQLPKDLDDILRIAFLATLGRDKTGSLNVLRQAAKARRRAAEERREEAGRLQKQLGSKLDLHAYRWLRATTEGARLSAEDRVLEQAAKLLEAKSKRK